MTKKKSLLHKKNKMQADSDINEIKCFYFEIKMRIKKHKIIDVVSFAIWLYVDRKKKRNHLKKIKILFI